MIDIGNIDNIPKNNAEEVDQLNFLTMDEYINMAKKTISRYGGVGMEYLLNSEDVVSNVATQMMVADWKYDSIKRRTRYSYRNQCAIWAIHKTQRRYSKEVKAEQIIPDMMAKKECSHSDIIFTKEVLQMPYLSSAQKSVLSNCYLKNMTLREAGKKLGLSKERIRQIKNSAISKLRSKMNE